MSETEIKEISKITFNGTQYNLHSIDDEDQYEKINTLRQDVDEIQSAIQINPDNNAVTLMNSPDMSDSSNKIATTSFVHEQTDKLNEILYTDMLSVYKCYATQENTTKVVPIYKLNAGDNFLLYFVYSSPNIDTWSVNAIKTLSGTSYSIQTSTIIDPGVVYDVTIKTKDGAEYAEFIKTNISFSPVISQYNSHLYCEVKQDQTRKYFVMIPREKNINAENNNLLVHFSNSNYVTELYAYSERGETYISDSDVCWHGSIYNSKGQIITKFDTEKVYLLKGCSSPDNGFEKFVIEAELDYLGPKILKSRSTCPAPTDNSNTIATTSFVHTLTDPINSVVSVSGEVLRDVAYPQYAGMPIWNCWTGWLSNNQYGSILGKTLLIRAYYSFHKINSYNVDIVEPGLYVVHFPNSSSGSATVLSRLVDDVDIYRPAAYKDTVFIEVEEWSDLSTPNSDFLSNGVLLHNMTSDPVTSLTENEKPLDIYDEKGKSASLNDASLVYYLEKSGTDRLIIKDSFEYKYIKHPTTNLDSAVCLNSAIALNDYSHSLATTAWVRDYVKKAISMH